MYGLLALCLCTFYTVTKFCILPVYRYYADRKGLRAYPNMSLFSGISDVPFALEARRGFRSKRLADLHKTYPVVRIGPNSLSYGDARAVKDIYGHGTKCIKDDFYSLLTGSHPHLADVIDKSEHQRKRKMLASAYAIKHLEDWEYKISEKVVRLIQHFDSKCSPSGCHGNSTEDSAVDFRAWSNFFTMDAIVDIGLSNSLGCLERGNDETTSEDLDGTCHSISYRTALHSSLIVQSTFVWLNEGFHKTVEWAKALSKRYNTLVHDGRFFDGIVNHQARLRLDRYRKGEELDDFFQALMEDRNKKPHGLDWGEIVAEISIMLNAGSASTAIAINNAVFMLLKHPEVLSKLREEIDAAAEDDEEAIAYDKVKNLPYLRACVDESMRIMPPTSFGLPRKTPKEGCRILDDWVSGGTTVSMSSYVVHRDERVFEEPERYRPERWLGNRGKELQPYFVAFSAGARGCIGRNISYLEQLVLVASVVHRYDLELPSPEWEPHRYEHFNLVPGPMPLKVSRRCVEKGSDRQI